MLLDIARQDIEMNAAYPCFFRTNGEAYDAVDVIVDYFRFSCLRKTMIYLTVGQKVVLYWSHTIFRATNM